MTIIAKATTKGQITLPVQWRKNFSTNRFFIKTKGYVLEIRPLDLAKLESQNDYTVFDAIRDNQGRDLEANDLIKILKNING